MQGAPAVTFQHVCFSYDGPLVLEDVAVSIRNRDFVCVIGPNGGGKTTLLRLMLGLLEPRRGSVEVLGTTPEQARHRIGYMPQHTRFDPQFPVSVMDVVLMGRLGRGAQFGPYGRSHKAVALRALEEVGLVDVRNRSFSALSSGQRQRVLIARALACEPELLLLDEPTANLDPAVQDSLYSLLRDLNERLTVITVSHDVGFVSAFFKTVVCVDRTVHLHPTSELTEQRVGEVYGRAVRFVHHAEAVTKGDGP